MQAGHFLLLLYYIMSKGECFTKGSEEWTPIDIPEIVDRILLLNLCFHKGNCVEVLVAKFNLLIRGKLCSCTSTQSCILYVPRNTISTLLMTSNLPSQFTGFLSPKHKVPTIFWSIVLKVGPYAKMIHKVV